MLAIRQSQLDAFQHHFDGILARKVAFLIKQNHPAQAEALGLEKTDGTIAEAIRHGRTLGFRTERELCALAEFYFLHGSDPVACSSEAHLTLATPSLSPLGRVERLYALVNKRRG